MGARRYFAHADHGDTDEENTTVFGSSHLNAAYMHASYATPPPPAPPSLQSQSHAHTRTPVTASIHHRGTTNQPATVVVQCHEHPALARTVCCVLHY